MKSGRQDPSDESAEIDNSGSHFGHLTSLLASGRLSDVTLRVGSEDAPFVEFRVHKFVLCAYSDVFEVSFYFLAGMSNY